MKCHDDVFFVVSNWNNDLSWIEDYTQNYIVYDKSQKLPTSEKVFDIGNYGYNIRDIFYFVYHNYENLPKFMAFLEGNPFDHCNRNTFDKIIHNKFFTSIEDYRWMPDTDKNPKASDGGYQEISTDCRVNQALHCPPTRTPRYCKYVSPGDLMNHLFTDYIEPRHIRFSAGGQYIVERERILHYPKSFWKFMMDDLKIEGHPTCVEGHLYERACWTIFSCAYTARNFE